MTVAIIAAGLVVPACISWVLTRIGRPPMSLKEFFILAVMLMGAMGLACGIYLIGAAILSHAP